MFKLAFVFAVLIAVAVSASPHARQTHAKKASVPVKHPAHHGLNLHGGPRVARSHGAHAPVHHSPGGSGHHSNKLSAQHAVHSVHGGSHGGNHVGNHAIHGGIKGVAHRPVKHRGHRK